MIWVLLVCSSPSPAPLNRIGCVFKSASHTFLSSTLYIVISGAFVKWNETKSLLQCKFLLTLTKSISHVVMVQIEAFRGERIAYE